MCKLGCRRAVCEGQLYATLSSWKVACRYGAGLMLLAHQRLDRDLSNHCCQLQPAKQLTALCTSVMKQSSLDSL